MKKKTAITISLFAGLACTLLPFTAAADTYQDAWDAYNNENFSQAIELWNTSIKEGDTRAYFDLASLYEEGKHVVQSDEKAAYWLEKSANEGIQGAQYRIGLYYRDGKGVPQSTETAKYWFKKAAEAGLYLTKRDLALLKQQEKNEMARAGRVKADGFYDQAKSSPPQHAVQGPRTLASCDAAYALLLSAVTADGAQAMNMSNHEMGWGLSWEKQKRKGELCDEIPPRLLGDGIPDTPISEKKGEYTLAGFSKKLYVLESHDQGIQGFKPTPSDCSTVIAAFDFLVDMNGKRNFMQSEHKWRQATRKQHPKNKHCPQIPQSLVSLGNDFVTRFGYAFPKDSSSNGMVMCHNRQRAIYHSNIGGELRRWASTLSFAMRYKNDRYEQDVCNMMTGDLYKDSQDILNKYFADERERYSLAKAEQRERDANREPDFAEGFQKGLEQMSRDIVTAKPKVYKCRYYSPGKEKCGWE